jgi:hypothetical protein
MNNKRRYGIYEVSESFTPEGLWQGYTVKAAASEGKQGKLYIKSDGRENYQPLPRQEKPEKGNSDDLEI